MRFSKAFCYLLLTSFLTSQSSCLKKGENDPLISFRTRKARLVGEWHLTSGTEERKSIYFDSLGRQEVLATFFYTKNSYQIIAEEGSGQHSGKGSFSYSIEFKKDGGYSSTQLEDNSNSAVSEGTWNFTKGVGKYKNKEQIVINLTSDSTTSSYPYSPTFIYVSRYGGNQSDITYTLKELRNKKLILVSEYGYFYSNGNGSSSKSELTFEQE